MSVLIKIETMLVKNDHLFVSNRCSLPVATALDKLSPDRRLPA